MLACPHSGDISSDPQLDVGMVLVGGELVLNFSCIAFHFSCEVLAFLQHPSKGK